MTTSLMGIDFETDRITHAFHCEHKSDSREGLKKAIRLLSNLILLTASLYKYHFTFVLLSLV